jgi:predicted aspartyl protease
MPITNYPFVRQGGKPRASLPIILENPENGLRFQTWALIDTGADHIVVPSVIAELLGHNIHHKKVKKSVCQGAGGRAQTFYHSFRMFVLQIDNKGIIAPNKAAIKIPKREFAVIQNLPIMLLGVRDFLEKYVLTIDYPQKTFSVKSP